ncbi:hypothetical protein ACJX0J_013265, partial [Zea mays]
DGKISYEEFVAMMKTGTDWRKASRHYSRGRFNSLSMKRWRSPASDASQAQQLQKILSCGALIDGMGSDFGYKWLDNTIMGIFLSSDTRHCSATDYSKPILDWLENSSDEGVPHGKLGWAIDEDFGSFEALVGQHTSLIGKLVGKHRWTLRHAAHAR